MTPNINTSIALTFNNATFNWIVQNLFIFLPSKHHEMAIYHPKWMKCSLCTTAEHGRNSRLRGGAMQSNSPLRSTTSVVSHLLTYIMVVHKLCWPNCAHYWPPTYPLLTYVGEFLYCHMYWENLLCISLTLPVPPTYLVLSIYFVNDPLYVTTIGCPL